MILSAATGIRNRLIVPFLDRLVMEKIKRYIHGNDRAASIKVSKVSVWPISDVEDLVCPPIPQKINDHLVEAANEAAKASIEKLRKELGLSSMGAEVISVSRILTGGELVHTSYFNNPDVLEIISGHIRLSTGTDMIHHDVNCNYTEWLVEFRGAVKEALRFVQALP
ncbi:MAG: hypothetical protein MN733_44210 [Nitrososphaera sp.]|nr:hypothetical protein [Nitrososphaera sp.]